MAAERLRNQKCRCKNLNRRRAIIYEKKSENVGRGQSVKGPQRKNELTPKCSAKMIKDRKKADAKDGIRFDVEQLIKGAS